MKMRKMEHYSIEGPEYLEVIKHEVLKSISQNSGFANRPF